MMHGDAVFDDDTAITEKDGNEIIDRIVSCLTGRGLSLKAAKYLLEETAGELDHRVKV